MGFLANAGDRLTSAVDSKASDWIDKGLAKLRTDVLPGLPSEGAGVTTVVMEKLTANKGLLEGITHAGLVQMAGYVSLGADDAARLVYLREQASFEEAQDALTAATRSALKRSRDDAETWRLTKAFLIELLLAAGKAAIPILMAMI